MSVPFHLMQEGARASVEVVSDVRNISFGEVAKTSLVVLLAIVLCVVVLGKIERDAMGGDWYFSFRAWFDNLGSAFDDFPVPETAVDYVTWTLQVIGWFIVLWSALFSGGWVQGTFDGTVGALPVQPQRGVTT